MIVRPAGVGLDEEIAPTSGYGAPAEHRLAGRQRAVLHRVEVSGVPEDLARADEQVAAPTRAHPVPDLLRDLHARLMAVRRLDRAVERVGQARGCPSAGTCPVVRNVARRDGAAAPPTVRCWNVPWIGAIVGKSRCAFGSDPPLDHSVALNSWPMLLASRSVKMP